MTNERKIPEGRLGRLRRLAGLGARTGASLLLNRDAGAAAAQQAAEVLGTLRGLAAKVGQMVSYVDGMVPEAHQKAYQTALRGLRAAAPTSSPQQIRLVVEQELAAPIDALFQEWDGEVVCSLDIRSAEMEILEACSKNLQEICAAICRKRSIDFEWNLVQQTAPVACNKKMNELLALCVKEAGYENIFLVSGAGHDAVPMSAITPVCMLFIRCFEGISHNPLEHVSLFDMATALQIADNFVHKLIQKNK